MTSSSIIWNNPHISSNWSWKLPVISIPIHITLQIKSWQHTFTSVRIHNHLLLGHDSILSDLMQCIYYLIFVVKFPFTSFPIHITLSILHDSIIYHMFLSIYHLKLRHDIILYHLFLSTYHLKLSHDIILYHLF
jgi:hypothetical protein